MTWHKPENHKYGCPCCGGQKVAVEYHISQTRLEEYDDIGVLVSSEDVGDGEEERQEAFCAKCEECFDDDWRYGKCPSCDGAGYECVDKFHCDQCCKLESDCSCERCIDCDEFRLNCECARCIHCQNVAKRCVCVTESAIDSKPVLFGRASPKSAERIFSVLEKAAERLYKSADVLGPVPRTATENNQPKPNEKKLQWALPDELPED